MIDVCLKFVDYSEASQVLSSYIYQDYWILASHTHSIDLVGDLCQGAIYDSTRDEHGEYIMLTAPQIKVGYHVNLRCVSLPGNLDDYIVNPQHRERVWA